MIRLATAPLALLWVVLAWGAVSSTGVAQSADAANTVSDTVSLSETGTVSIENDTGSINVTTWNRAAVGYDVRLKSTSQDSVDLSALSVEQSEDEFELQVGSSSWSIRIPGLVTISPGGTAIPVAHFHVRIPQRAQLEIDDRESDIRVSGLNAAAEIDTYDGSVEVDSVDGMLRLDTYASPVNATNLRGGINIETYDGRVDASFEEFSAASSVDSYSGTVHVYLPSTTGFELRGELEDLDIMVADPFGSPTIEDERRIYGGGGPPLSLDTFSGRVEIHALQAESSAPGP